MTKGKGVNVQREPTDDDFELVREANRRVPGKVNWEEVGPELLPLYGKLHDHAASMAHRLGIWKTEWHGQPTPIVISQILDIMEKKIEKPRG